MSQEESKNEINVEELQKALNEKDTMIKDLQQQFTAVKSKADQLLDETKKAKARAREEAEAKEKAELERARKNGDFEQLLKSSETERQTLANELNELRNRISSEKTRTEAMKVAAELADGSNAEILSEFVSRRLKYTDDGLKVLNESGELTVSTLDELKREFENSSKFKSLLRGSQASGGGAQGGGSGAAKEINQADFEKMTAPQQMEFLKKGGEIV